MTYVLERNEGEYERLRRQSSMWEEATARLLDRIALVPGATCLDVGCGTGDAMRLMAERVGPSGHVTGIDVDADVGAHALERLHAAGHRQTTFEALDVNDAPHATFDLVFARLLLLHVDDRPAVLRSLWDRVALGGHLVVMEHDMDDVGVVPPLPSTDEFFRVVLGTFAGAGNGTQLGRHLPRLHHEAGIGAPDGADVIGRLEPLHVDANMFAAIYRSMLPAAISLGLATPDRGERWFDHFERDVSQHGDRVSLWPLMIGTWKRK